MCGMGERDAKTGLFLRVLLMALWAGAALAAADADGPADLLTAADFLEWERVSEPRISPDGARVLFTRGWVDRMHDRWESEIWIMGSDGGDKRFLTKGSSARWSPDGTRIAYLAEGEPSGTQIFVLRLDAPTPTQVTRVERPPASLRWSPQGDRFAFVMRVPPEDPWTVDLPPAPEGATWTEPPRIVDGVYFRQDRRGFMQDGYVHLFVVEADGGTPRQLTRGRWNVGARTYGLEFGAGIDWTPDGRYLVFDGLREDDASRLYRRSHLYAVEVASREVRRLTSAKGPWTGPIVSPDGKHVAFTGYPWTLQTYLAQDVWVMGMDGSEMRAITAGLDRDAADLHWLPDGSGVAFTAGDRGSSQAYVAPLDGSGARAVTFGTHMLSLGSVSRDGNAVGVLEAPHEPGDVVRYALERGASPERLTAVHADVLEDRTLGEVEEILARSPEATAIRSREGVSADPAHPRRAARDVQRELQLLVSVPRGPRISRAVHESSRQHRLRHRLRQRHRQRVPERGLRRPDGVGTSPV